MLPSQQVSQFRHQSTDSWEGACGLSGKPAQRVWAGLLCALDHVLPPSKLLWSPVVPWVLGLLGWPSWWLSGTGYPSCGQCPRDHLSQGRLTTPQLVFLVSQWRPLSSAGFQIHSAGQKAARQPPSNRLLLWGSKQRYSGRLVVPPWQ